MRKPNVFIVGAAKCGTTAPYEYLRRHPDIYMSPEKEPAYFCPDLHKQRRSEEEYLQLFAEADKKLFDITVVTFYPGAILPETFLIAEFRLSAWTKAAGGILCGFSGG